MRFPISGNVLNSYILPPRTPAVTGLPIFSPATNFAPTDGFWDINFRRIILISSTNSGVYNYNYRNNTTTLHQQAGLVAGDQGDLNRAGDRIAAIRANNLTILQYDNATGLLSADITLTDSVSFGLARECAWSPDGNYIAVAINDIDSGDAIVRIVQYIRSPASLTIVASFLAPADFQNCETIVWGINNVIVASGTQTGMRVFRFEPATNTITQVQHITGAFRLNSMSFSINGDFLVGIEAPAPDKITVFSFTTSPDTLTLLNTLTLPHALSNHDDFKITWDTNTRNILLGNGGGVSHQSISVLRFDPVGMGLTMHGSFLHGSTGTFKGMINNINHVVAYVRDSSSQPIMIMPFASNINI